MEIEEKNLEVSQQQARFNETYRGNEKVSAVLTQMQKAQEQYYDLK
jgi:hypothetical protein